MPWSSVPYEGHTTPCDICGRDNKNSRTHSLSVYAQLTSEMATGFLGSKILCDDCYENVKTMWAGLEKDGYGKYLDLGGPKGFSDLMFYAIARVMAERNERLNECGKIFKEYSND